MDDQHARELLARQRSRVEQALAHVAHEGDESVADRSDPTVVGEELVDEELDQAHAEQLRGELEAIERAERRLVEGTFGVSIESGEPIPDARLDAIPWAERTAAEQARYEAGGG